MLKIERYVSDVQDRVTMKAVKYVLNLVETQIN
jgi:hypothetical protein